uniref:Uncharacterized protein n=1 Tax=Salix viminalis TaxID=40686 RepID=A0A6N2N634_SALVM
MPTMMFFVSISILKNRCSITLVMKSCHIYSRRTKSLNPFQRMNTRRFKVNSFSTTVWSKEVISFPILVLHPVSRSHQLRFDRLGKTFRVVVAPDVRRVLRERTIE